MRYLRIPFVWALIVLTLSGCTWTETYRDYPPGVESRQAPDDAEQIVE